MGKLLDVRNLKTIFETPAGTVKAVDGVSYHIDEGEIVGMVGESGCGKSITQLSILQLIPNPPGKIFDGEVFFEDRDLLKLDPEGDRMRAIRGGKIGMIFQEPMTSLNPVLTIAEQLKETMVLHLGMDKKNAEKRAAEMLEVVGIPDAMSRLYSYPHQFSGGMRQRVMIAMALSCNPKLVIADEPTTALDVTTQAQILDVMMNMVKRFKTSLIIVTHNLGIVARYVERIHVMYAGRIVEIGSTGDIFGDPRHPYTIALLKSVPRLDEPRDRELIPILGMPPNLIDMPPVCAFKPRCAFESRCQNEQAPELRQIGEDRFVSCHLNIQEMQDGLLDR